MEKWEQELKKQVNLPLPEHLDQHIDRTIKQLKRNNNTIYRLRYGAAAVAASLALTFGMSSLSPTFAEVMKSLPIIGSVFEMVGDIGVKRGSQLNLATKFGQQVVIGDQVVTFTEFLYDGSNINLGFITQPNEKDPMSFVKNVIFTVDGKRLQRYSSTASGEKLDNETYAGTISINVDDEIPNAFVLGIMSRDETKTLFAEIPIERNGDNQSFIIDKTKKWNGTTIKYDKVTLFPTSTEIAFQLQNTNNSPFWEFKVYDERGRVLQPISGNGAGSLDDDYHHFKYYFEPFDSIPKQLTIQPYLSSPLTTSKINWEWKGTPITLSQGEVGSIIVLDEKLENNKLTITYKVEGEHIFEQVNHIWLEDKSGIPYYKDNPIRFNGSNNTYQVTFSNVNNMDSIFICTRQYKASYYLDDLAVTIDLQQ